MPFVAGELITEQFATADAFLLGRGTYQIFAGYWPQVTDSHGLVQTLTQARLVDEYRVWVFPVVLGARPRLFGPGTVPTALELTGSEVTSTGVALHTYRPVGLPRHGEFAVSDQGASTAALPAG